MVVVTFTIGTSYSLVPFNVSVNDDELYTTSLDVDPLYKDAALTMPDVRRRRSRPLPYTSSLALTCWT